MFYCQTIHTVEEGSVTLVAGITGGAERRDPAEHRRACLCQWKSLQQGTTPAPKALLNASLPAHAGTVVCVSCHRAPATPDSHRCE